MKFRPDTILSHLLLFEVDAIDCDSMQASIVLC